MANIKLDFSKMRHVKSDKDTTTLKHKTDGHEITLVHKALSPDNQQRLMALAGIAKSAATPQEADQMAHKMATGGTAPTQHISEVESKGVDAASALQNQRITDSSSAPVDPNEDAKYQAMMQHLAQPSPTPGPAPQAKGGEIKKTENTLDYSKIKKKPYGGDTQSTIDYSGFKEDQRKKDLDDKYKKYAEGGSTETCMACGGSMRKAYATSDQPVSQDDSAPEVPTNLDPKSAGVPTSVPNYRDPQQAAKEPFKDENSETARTKEVYNRMVSNVVPKGMTAPISLAQFHGDQPPAQFNGQTYMNAQKEVQNEQAMNAAAVSGQQQNIIKENQARIAAGLAPLPIPDIPNGPQVPGTPENPPQPNAINPSGQPVDTADDATQNMLALSNKGFQNQMAGIKGTAQAQEAQAAANSQIYDTQAKAEQNILNNYQDAYHSIDGEMDAIRNDIANNHISPEQYWTGDKDGNGSHSKIATGIGMILAGFNPTNRPNAAIDFLKFNMEQNLKAQVQEMSKKQNVLTSLQNKFHNMRDTMDFARLTNAQMAIAQLGKAAANATGGPNGLAANAAKQAQGVLQVQYAPLQQRIAMSQTMMHMAAQPTGDPDMEVAQATKMARYATALGDTQMAKQWQDATVPGVGVTRNLAPVPDAVKTQIATHKTVSDIMNQALEIAKQPIPTNPTEYAKYEARASTLQGQLIGMVKQAQHDGVYKPSEAEFLTSQIGGSPGSVFRSLSAIPKIQELQEVKQNEYNNLLQTYNLPTRQLPRANTAPEQTKTVNGVTYKRGPNGEAIRVP